MKKIFFISILFLNIFPILQAQDLITTRKKQQIRAHVLEMNDKYVQYRPEGYTDGPVITMQTREIRKILFFNGDSTELMQANPRFRHPFGINVGLAILAAEDGGGFIDLNTEYFIIPQVAMVAEVGTDLEDGFYFLAGGRYHVNRNFTSSGFTPFLGLLAGSYLSAAVAQLPIGINYIAPFGLNTSFSVNQLFFFHSNYVQTYVELKLGWHF
jgi:hypothetical protein